MNKLEDYFYNKPKKYLVHKWLHYFEIYEKHFSRFLGKSPTILEVGVSGGGSLEMWNHYFDGQCTIYGVDVNPACKKVDLPNTQIVIGDQASRKFWRDFKKSAPKFDIVIEDGGHRMRQQIITFECMYDHVKEDGVYLCEDLHTSYWDGFGRNRKGTNTFIEYTKKLIDRLNAWHHRPQGNLGFRQKTHSIHYYDSVIVLEKRKDLTKPNDIVKRGKLNCSSFPKQNHEKTIS